MANTQNSSLISRERIVTELLKDFQVIHRDITSLITVILNAAELTELEFLEWNEIQPKACSTAVS